MPKARIKNYQGRNFRKIREDDKLSREHRSSLMSKILSKDTKFERGFISLLKKFTNKKFQTNVLSIKGKPDIVFEKEKLCIFLDSDFWHGWQYLRWKHLLKDDFWRVKINNNRIRDIRNRKYLTRNGWRVIRLWEHQIKNDPNKAIREILNFFSS